MEERRERVLTPSAGAAAYRGRRHAGSRWRGTVAQCHGDSGKREQRACTQSAAPPSANAALAEVMSRNRTSATRTQDEQRHSTQTAKIVKIGRIHFQEIGLVGIVKTGSTFRS